MVDADGNHVVAVPDMAAWQQYQEKAKAAAANKEVVIQGSKELQERGLECSIDKRLFVDPVKTPCCNMTYCRECIDNALSDHDLVCPHCSTENVLIDDLLPDEEMSAKLKAYLEEKKLAAQKQKSPSPTAAAQQTPQKKGVLNVPSPTSSPTPSNKRKRSVDDDNSADSKRTASTEGNRPNSSGSGSTAPSTEQIKTQPLAMSNEDFVKQMNAMAAMQGGDARNTNNAFNPMALAMMPMAMPNGMMNPMMMMMQNSNQFPGMVPSMQGLPTMNNNIGMAYSGNGANMGFPNGVNGQGMHAQGMNGQGMNGQGMNGHVMNGNPNMHGNRGFQNNNSFRGRGGIPTGPKRFQNQQPNQAEEAYLRKPVNPHRHQGRQKRVRPTDFKEL